MGGSKKKRKDFSAKGDMSHLDMGTANAGSSTDCTGLIPAKPASKAEREAYKELYDYEAGPDNGSL